MNKYQKIIIPLFFLIIIVFLFMNNYERFTIGSQRGKRGKRKKKKLAANERRKQKIDTIEGQLNSSVLFLNPGEREKLEQQRNNLKQNIGSSLINRAKRRIGNTASNMFTSRSQKMKKMKNLNSSINENSDDPFFDKMRFDREKIMRSLLKNDRRKLGPYGMYLGGPGAFGGYKEALEKESKEIGAKLQVQRQVEENKAALEAAILEQINTDKLLSEAGLPTNSSIDTNLDYYKQLEASELSPTESKYFQRKLDMYNTKLQQEKANEAARLSKNIRTISPPISRTSSPETSRVNTGSINYMNLLKQAKTQENYGSLDELNNIFRNLNLTPNVKDGRRVLNNLNLEKERQKSLKRSKNSFNKFTNSKNKKYLQKTNGLSRVKQMAGNINEADFFRQLDEIDEMMSYLND